MKKTILCILLITAGVAKSESTYQQIDSGEWMLYTNSVENIIRSMYIMFQGWGVPLMGADNRSDIVYDTFFSGDLSTYTENQLLSILQRGRYVGSKPSSFQADVGLPQSDTYSFINYRNWMLDYYFRLAHGTYTNTLNSQELLKSIDTYLGFYLGMIDHRLTEIMERTNEFALASADWKTWKNEPSGLDGIERGWYNMHPTISQLPAQEMLSRMGWGQQLRNNLDYLADYGMTQKEMEDLLGDWWPGSDPVFGEVDGIPKKLLDKASKSLKFHVSMKAKTNALHAVLGFKGTNTLEDAVKKVVEEIKGVREGVSNIAEAGGLGGSGTNEFCCYFGLAWSNFQERTEIKLPPGVSSWDEFLRGWQQDMHQITESGDMRLRQWWGMMYTQTLLLDRQKREITGFGGLVTRASNQTNAVDEIVDKVQEDLQQADKWQSDLEGDIGRLYVSNVAPRVLEPMENFAKGLKGPEKRRLLKAAGNDEVVLLEWTGLGLRIAFDKSQMEDVAEKVRAFIRAFLYLLDAVIILYIGICAFRLVGRAYEFAHSCV